MEAPGVCDGGFCVGEGVLVDRVRSAVLGVWLVDARMGE